MEKYKTMFWSLLLGLTVGTLFLTGIGFLTTVNGDAVAAVAVVAVAAAVVVAVATAATTAVIAVVTIVAIVVVMAAAIAVAAVISGSIPSGILFLAAVIVAGIGCLIIYRKFKQKDVTIVTTFVTVAGVVLIGFIPAIKVAYVWLIPKDQGIIQSLQRKDLTFTLPMNEERYFKEFFFLGQKDGNPISFRDGKFELKKTIHRSVFPDGSVKNETKEMMTVSFDGIDLATIEGLIIRHPFAPQTKISLEAIGKQ